MASKNTKKKLTTKQYLGAVLQVAKRSYKAATLALARNFYRLRKEAHG